MSAVKVYPRLLITRRSVPVLVSATSTNRVMDQRRFWCVVYVRRLGEDSKMFLGSDDGIFGWAECVDFASAVIRKARSQR